jgi:hypothetical protein
VDLEGLNLRPTINLWHEPKAGGAAGRQQKLANQMTKVLLRVDNGDKPSVRLGSGLERKAIIGLNAI